MVDIVSRQGDIISSDTVTTTDTRGNRVTVTETTTVDRDGGSILTDVSYIPFMRGLGIDFLSYGLRTTRQVWTYFDALNMSNFVQRPNIIELDTRKGIRGMESGAREVANLNNSLATIYINETGIDTGNTKLYVSNFSNPTIPVEAGNTVVGGTSGLSGNVISYQHNSGIAGSGSNTTAIFLSLDADAATEEYYTSNVITLMNGESSEIVNYNAASRIANVFPAFTSVEANTIYSIGDSRKDFASNNQQALYTT